MREPQTGSPRRRRGPSSAPSHFPAMSNPATRAARLTLNTLPKAPSPSSPMISQNSSGFRSLLTCSYCFFFFSPPSLKILRKLKKDILAAAGAGAGGGAPSAGRGRLAGRDSPAETQVLARPGRRRHRRALRETPHRGAPGRAGLAPLSLPAGLGGPYSAGPGTIAAATSAGLAARDGRRSRRRGHGWAGRRRRAAGAVTSRLAGRGGSGRGGGCPAPGSRPVSSRSGVPGWQGGGK